MGSTSFDILTGDASSIIANGDTSIDIFADLVTNNNSKSNIVEAIVGRVNTDIFLSGTKSANNPRSLINTVVAVEAVKDLIEYGSFSSNGSNNSTGNPIGKLTPNFGTTIISDNTTSTSTTTGALKVSGGVGIVENVNVGGTLGVTGDLTVNTNKFIVTASSGDTSIEGTLDVTGAATLGSATVSDLTSGRVVLAGTSGALEDSGNLTFDGLTLTLSSNHLTTSDYNVATVKYVNDVVHYGVHWIKPCYVATTTSLSVSYSNGTSGVGATLTNSGTQVALSIDGITLSIGDRVLVKDQTSATQNGVYTVTDIGSGSTSWVLTRAGEFDGSSEILPGAAVFITNGSTYADTGFVLSSDGTNGTITVGTSDIEFVQFSGVNTVNVTVDRDNSTQSNSDPTTLSEALNDIYYKLYWMDNWLKNTLNTEITFSTSYTATTATGGTSASGTTTGLDFDAT